LKHVHEATVEKCKTKAAQKGLAKLISDKRMNETFEVT